MGQVFEIAAATGQRALVGPHTFLETNRRRIASAVLGATPDWAKPIVAAALVLDPKFAANR